MARWLDDQGISGLWERLEQLSLDYQQERNDLERDDFTSLVIRALTELCINHASCANCANHLAAAGEPHWLFSSAQLVEFVTEVDYLSETAVSHHTRLAQRVGITLRKMRLKKPPRSGGRGSRQWLITLTELRRWTAVYNIPLPESLQPDSQAALPEPT